MKEDPPCSPPLSPTRRVLEGVRGLSRRAIGRDPNASPPKIGDWGRPGHLAPEEVKVYVSFLVYSKLMFMHLRFTLFFS